MSLTKGLTGAVQMGSAGASTGNPYAAAGGALLGLGLGLFSSDEDAEAERAAQAAAFSEIMAIGAPPQLAREILLKHYEQGGILTPEVEEKIKQIDPVQIKENAQNRSMQMEVANKYKSLSETGMGAEDYALQNKLMNEAERAQQANQASILQKAQMTGQSGSGNELAAQLLSSQAGANRQMEGELEIGAQAQRRALEALGSYGNMAGAIREGDYRTESKNADTANEFSRFNTTNQIEREKRRVASENAAKEFNVKRGQDVSDANANQDNTEKLRQRTAENQDYQNEIGYRTRRAGAYTGQATQAGARQQKSDDETKGLMDAGSTGLKGLGQLGAFKQSSDQSAAKSADYDGLEAGKYGADSLETPELGSQYKKKKPYSFLE